MAVSILINDQKKVVADVIPVALITEIGDETKIYTGADWLKCDGSAVSRTEYADLFAEIGTTFGPGDGTTTFNLPNSSPTVVTGEKIFSQFITETVIRVENTSPMSVDISAGAVQAGIRISIIETTAQTVTIYTDSEHEQSCVLPKGMIVLEWDGDQWCLISETVRILVTITEDGEWTTPFGAVYKLSPVGGGGGGGSASATQATAYGGGGAGGSCQQLSIYEPAGTTLTVTIGGGGNDDHNGGNTTLTDGTITLTAMGGGKGGQANASGGSTAYGYAGHPRNATPITMAVEIGVFGGVGGMENKSGYGGNGACGAGLGGAAVSASNNGSNGGNYGGGGSGGAYSGTGGTRDGGDGADGVAFIEY
ncbi:MAG: tail fiber protein [Spirochaetales bacterium]|nr:tail fiber protein [Spirochaetales bacterium]